MSEPWYRLAFDRLYPLLYPHRDAAEAALVAERFGGRFAGGGTVLDLACGGGRFMESFRASGVEMVGVDLSGFLLGEAARKPDLEGRLAQADMRRVPIASQSVAGVINMFTSFGYFADDADNAAVLGEVARVLEPKGVFLFDFINRETVAIEPGNVTTRESGGYRLEERRALIDDGRFIVKRVRAQKVGDDSRLEYDERLRLYTRGELVGMLSAVGLDVAATFGDYTQAPFDPATSPRLIMLCEKGAEHHDD